MIGIHRPAHLIDSNTIVVVDRTTAHVRVARIYSGVNGRALFRQNRPPTLSAGDHTGPDSTSHLGDGQERTTGVRYAHLVSSGNGPRGGIPRVD